jgi:anti-sigma factor RsiW
VTCRDAADFILEYLAGTLDPDTNARFEWHLSRCGNCLEYLAQYRRTIELGRRAFDDDVAPAVLEGMPEDLVTAILAARPNGGRNA